MVLFEVLVAQRVGAFVARVAGTRVFLAPAVFALVAQPTSVRLV